MGKAFIIKGLSFDNDNLGKVTFAEEVAIESISINGPSIVSVQGNTAEYSISYTPSDTTQTGVKWSVIQGSQYAEINENTGVLTVLSGASLNNVLIKATSIHDESVFITKEVQVTYNKWYIDAYTGYQTDASNSRFYPMCPGYTEALIGVPINTMKFECTDACTVEICVYSFDGTSAPTEVSTVGTFQCIAGANELTFSDNVILSAGQVLGFKSYSGTTGAKYGVKYNTAALGTPIDGGWAGALFNGTIRLAFGKS